MAEQPPPQKHHRSDDSSDEEGPKKPKFQASTSGLQCGNQLQLSIDERIRQLSAYESDPRRGSIATKESIQTFLDAMRAEIIGNSAVDKKSLRQFLPDEVLFDIFVYLARIHLEKLQYACRRFWTVVDLRMTNVCYRVISCVHIGRDHFGTSVTAWIGNGNAEYGSNVSEHGERRAVTLKADHWHKDHITDVLSSVCRNAEVLVYKISDVDLSEAWPKFVPADANRMTIPEFILDGCTIDVPRDSEASPDTIVMGMLGRFQRVHEVRLSIETNRDGGFTDRFLEFCAAREINSVNLSSWDKGISENGVINFLLNASSKRALSFATAYGLTAGFYDALFEASEECTTAYTASLFVDDCDDGLPRIRDTGVGISHVRTMKFRPSTVGSALGLLPVIITREDSLSRTSILFKRSDTAVPDDDEAEDDGHAQDVDVDDNDE